MSAGWEYIVYYLGTAAYLCLFVVLAVTLHKMQRALTRIADRLDASGDKSA